MEVRNCKRCNGEGTVFNKGFTSLEGTVYPDRTDKCSGCDGLKTFPSLDEAAIRAIIFTKRGEKRLLTAFPTKLNRWEDLNNGRAYYVWRLARFHGGKDMTMPMTAGIITRSDPFKDELDKFADVVAKEAFGTDLAGAARWARAFGV